MTDEIPEAARQMAADLANAECDKLGYKPIWAPCDFSSPNNAEIRIAFARLCARVIEMEADWAEVDRIASLNGWAGPANYADDLKSVAAIAAKHRPATDPLVPILRDLLSRARPGDCAIKLAEKLRTELAKRGLELAKRL